MPAIEDSSPFLTIEQVAERLNCSTITIRRQISRGELRAVRFGRNIRIRQSDLERSLRPVTPLGAAC